MAEAVTAEQVALITSLVDRQARQRARVADRVAAAVRRSLARLAGRWYDEDAVRVAAEQMADVVRQGQVVTADLTSEYIDQTLSALGVDPSENAILLPDRLREVPLDEQWQRPAKVYRRARLLGGEELAAAEAAARRAEQMAAMDLNLAMRESARQRLADVASIRGYRRVIHPELSRTGTCGLCLVASDRLYVKGDLLPIHGGCNCEVLPVVIGKADPGVLLNAADLRRVYEAAGGTAAAELKKIRVRTVQHGELGPILVDAGHRFRDLDTADADRRATA